MAGRVRPTCDLPVHYSYMCVTRTQQMHPMVAKVPRIRHSSHVHTRDLILLTIQNASAWWRLLCQGPPKLLWVMFDELKCHNYQHQTEYSCDCDMDQRCCSCSFCPLQKSFTHSLQRFSIGVACIHTLHCTMSNFFLKTHKHITASCTCISLVWNISTIPTTAIGETASKLSQLSFYTFSFLPRRLHMLPDFLEGLPPHLWRTPDVLGCPTHSPPHKISPPEYSVTRQGFLRAEALLTPVQSHTMWTMRFSTHSHAFTHI